MLMHEIFELITIYRYKEYICGSLTIYARVIKHLVVYDPASYLLVEFMSLDSPNTRHCTNEEIVFFEIIEI